MIRQIDGTLTKGARVHYLRRFGGDHKLEGIPCGARYPIAQLVSRDPEDVTCAGCQRNLKSITRQRERFGLP